MIDILLATYRPDPARLAAQIGSIRAQEGVETNLIVREDAAGEGARANFAALLAASTAPYVAFADQDDVWKADKLRRSMEAMRRLEARFGAATPLLVFTDAAVVDDALRPLDASLFRRTKIDPRRVRPAQLALQNVANGNTMLFNAALRDRANPIPPEAFMHDHWVMLVASVFGRIACVDAPTLLYRQHAGNVLGGAKVGAGYFARRVLDGPSALRRRLYANVRQAAAFVDRFGDAAPASLRALAGIAARPWPLRVATLVRHGIFKNGLLRNLGTFCLI